MEAVIGPSFGIGTGRFLLAEQLRKHTLEIVWPFVAGLEVGNMGNFEVSPDGQFIVFQGNYGYMHLISAKVGTNI